MSTTKKINGCRHFSEAEAVGHWKYRTDRAMTRFCLATAQSWAKSIKGDTHAS